MYGEADKAVTWEDAEGERKCLRLKVKGGVAALAQTTRLTHVA